MAEGAWQSSVVDHFAPQAIESLPGQVSSIEKLASIKDGHALIDFRQFNAVQKHRRADRQPT